MLRDKAYDYFVNKDFNCAETLLHAANDEYKLELTDDAFRAIGGFGGGMGCGNVCGALVGCIAGISAKKIAERAHVTKGLKDLTTEMVNEFCQGLGSDNCKILKDKYWTKEKGCVEVVLRAADELEKVMARDLAAD